MRFWGQSAKAAAKLTKFMLTLYAFAPANALPLFPSLSQGAQRGKFERKNKLYEYK